MPEPAVEFHLLNPNGTYRCPLPAVGAFDLSLELNSPGAVSFDYPVAGENWSALHEFVPGKGAAQLSIWPGGQSTGALRSILLTADRNDVAETKTVKYSGFFYEYRLVKTVVWNQPSPADKGELHFGSANGGAIVRVLMQQAQARGALTDITYASFSNTVDSNGVTWPTVANIKFSPGATYLSVLEKLVDIGLCEFEMRGPDLRLYVPGGRGVDRTLTTGVTFQAGRDLTEAPRTFDAKARVSALLLAGDQAVYSTVSDATAQAQIGWREEGYASQAGLSDSGSVNAWGQTRLLAAKVPDDTLTAALTFATGSPVPLQDFGLADWVWADTSGAKERVQVSQLVLSRPAAGEAMTGSVTLGDRTDSDLVKLARKLASFGDGSAVIGTSTATAGGDDTLAPAAPTGLVASSIAYQDADLGDTYAAVTLGWSAVTTNTDGSGAGDVAGYRVQYAYLGLNQVGPTYVGAPDPVLHWYEPTPFSGVTGTSFTFVGVGAGADIGMRVAAFDNSGNQGPWSTRLDMTTQVDNTPPPVASTPTVAAWFGTARITWDGLGSAGQVMPLDFDHIEVHLSTANNFTPTVATFQANLYAKGTWNVADLVYGSGYYARLVAVDRAGNKAVPSATSAAVTPEQLVTQDLINGIIDATKMGPNSVQSTHIVNGAITTAKIGTAQIITALIADLSVNNAKIADLSVGKLTAGTMTADVLLSGIIRTALSGARSEIDAAGLRLYNAAGTNTVNLKSTDGTALLTGTVQSALSGQRWIMNTTGDMLLYPPAGSAYSRLWNLGNALAMRGPLNANGRSGRMNVDTLGCGINFSNENDLGNLFSEVLVQQTTVRMTSPTIVLRADRSFSTSYYGGQQLTALVIANSSGADIAKSLIQHQTGGGGEAWLASPSNNSGIICGPSYIAALGNAGGSIEMRASAFNFGSSRLAKLPERPIAWIADGRTYGPSALVSTVQAVEWMYLHEQKGTRPARPGVEVRSIRRDEHGVPVLDRLGCTVYDYTQAEWEWDEHDPPKHYGPMAEDIARVAPSLVRVDPETGQMMLNAADIAGVAWGAAGENTRHLATLDARLAVLEKHLGLVDAVVDGEVV